ncbi:MAG TPA: metallophosphoesterase [Niabella sp.]|jgi:predicted MPP superfamily phosphohydrolase|nr:metallophosphoesterase [Chitinophagaceae bacterium]HUN03869.1 metallophosphoesterase [Niabella sp.]
MRNSLIWWIILGIMILADVYVFFAIKSLFHESSQRSRTIFTISYLTVSVSAVVILILLPYFNFPQKTNLIRSTIFALIAALFFAKILALLFFLVDDLRRGVQWIAGKLFSMAGSEVGELSGAENGGISRSTFLTWMGIVAGGGLFGTFINGLGNKYNYQIKRIKLAFDNLPPAFKGFKIVQISDIHSGSFSNKAAVNRGVDKILNENPDLILFTGDLVNNQSDEMENYTDVFARLQAPFGVFSILGNHDYGDYLHWNSPEAKQANLEKLKSIHAQMNWRLMLDENLPIEKGGSTIGLIGVQNISGKSGFHTYGNLKKAMEGAEKYPFTILMSHDPSHWDKEVITNYAQIDLTLSGHTHGMQFGVEVPGFRWSPVQYVYKRWAGLYTVKNQKLYVNRGYGFIGYPGRVGILPEITVIELT